MCLKKHFVFSQEPKLEKKKSTETEKEKKQFINKHSYEQHQEIRWSHICRCKISLWKNRSSLQEHEERTQTRMGN